jgi:7-keto-8-aminopelargonate synthetase-like enzyme
MKVFSLSSRINRTIADQGEEYLLFSGTAYLGMASLPAFEDLVMEGAKRFGLNHGWSRGNNVQLSVYDEFEHFFSEQAGSELSLLFSSGYLAGRAALSELMKTADLIYAAPDTHPAILPDNFATGSGSFDEWQQHVSSQLMASPAANVLLLANAVNALHPEIYDFQWVNDLPSHHQYTLLIDDSHAFGVVGNGIFGTYSQWKNLKAEVVISGSLNKGLCIPAGIVLGMNKRLTSISQQYIFRSSSPPTPGNLFAFLKGQHLYHQQSQKLNILLSFFKEKAANIKGLQQAGTLPVVAFEEDTWVKQLAAEKILVSSFPYPGKDDPYINRFVISAHHEKEDLLHLIGILNK